MNKFSSIELLESRIAPAGLVTVTVSGGNLVISGDAEANDISITYGEATNSFYIQGNEGTLLRLGTKGESMESMDVSGIMGNVTMNLLGGDDKVSGEGLYIPKNLTVNLGEGVNLLKLNGLFVEGNTTITAKGGNDTVEFYGIDTQLSGNVLVDLGNGYGQLNFMGSGSTHVGGTFNYKGGVGGNYIYFDSSYTSYAAFEGSFNITGDSTGIYAVVDSFYVGGDFRVVGQSYSDTYIIANQIMLEKNVFMKTGTASFFKMYSDTLNIGGNLNVQNGNGGAYSEGTTLNAVDIHIGGSVTINNGEGVYTNDISADRVFIDGAVNITNGDHTDASTTYNNIFGAYITIGKGLNIKNGLGVYNNVIGYYETEYEESSLWIGKGINITNGEHYSFVTETYIYSDIVMVKGDVNIKNAVASTSENSIILKGSRVSVSGNVLFTGGNGGDSFIAKGDQFTTGKNLSINAGAGSMLVDMESYVMDIAGSVSIKKGNGNYGVTLTGWGSIGGALNLDLGRGSDSGVSIYALHINGTMTVKYASLAGDYSSLSIWDSTIKSLNIIGGKGNETIDVLGCIVAGGVNINTGDGADSVGIGSTQVLSTVNIKTGDGYDTLSFDSYSYFGVPSVFKKSFIVDMGKGDDGIYIGSSYYGTYSIFENKAVFNGGAGYDIYYYETAEFLLPNQPVLVGMEEQ